MLSSWFYPKPTCDPGRDRNARTLQFTCVLFALAIGFIAALDLINQEWEPVPILALAVAGFVAAAVMNRAGEPTWAARIVLLAFLAAAILLVFEARDGFRSLAMLFFPALLLISVMLLDRTCYLISASIILAAIAGLGVAEIHAFTKAIPGVRSPTSYQNIFNVDFFMLVFAAVGSRIARDAQSNVVELRATVDRSSDSEQRLTMAQNAAHLGVWDRDMRTNVITICGKYAELHGLSPDRATLQHEEWVNLIHPDDRVRVHALRREALERTHSFDAEYRVIWPGGSIHWLHAKGVVLLDDSRRPIRSMGVIWDVSERKQAEDTLRESEERFRNMADSAPVMIWVSRQDKLCTFFNKPWLEFTGRSMEQELGDGWASGVHPDDLDRCLVTYNSSFDARQRFAMEYRLRRSDGEYRWILDIGTPLYRGSEFAGYVGSCIDITEHKSIEEGLRASKVQLLDAQRLANLGSWDRDVATGRVNWSDELYRVSGLETPPQTFPDYVETVHPKDRDLVRQAHDKARSSSSPEVVTYRILRPDGEMRFVRAIVEAVRDAEGRVIRLVGAIQDTTEQFKAQELLLESEKRLKRAEQLAGLGHWDWDLKNDRVYWSEEVFRITGHAADYIPSYKDILRHIAPQDRERADRVVANAMDRKSGFSLEFETARPNGERRTLKSIGKVLLDEDGKLVRLFGTVQDITDFKRAQEEASTQRRLETVGTLANGIAHDFNNLLGSVLAQAELGLGELAAGSNPEEELKAIRNVAVRGSEIVRQLMIYAGKESAVVEPADISEIIWEMLELLTVSVSKHAALQADLGKNLPAVCANTAQLRQLVMNLVTNASDALGDRDGVIRVATRCVRPGPDLQEWIRDRAAEGDYVQLEVSDTGCGMPPEMQAKVFDPFFTTKSGGRGLGLAIVQGIVRGLDGAIHLTSEPGIGTTVRILLPCVEAAAASRDMTSIVEPLPGAAHYGTILVVEDEGPLRQAVTKILRKDGFDVIEVADGSSAVDLVRVDGDEIDLVLLDLTIPGASSAEVVEAAAKARPDIKVILTSAYGEEMVAGAICAPQICGFIRKPFQTADLVKTLRNALYANSSDTAASE